MAHFKSIEYTGYIACHCVSLGSILLHQEKLPTSPFNAMINLHHNCDNSVITLVFISLSPYLNEFLLDYQNFHVCSLSIAQCSFSNAMNFLN